MSIQKKIEDIKQELPPSVVLIAVSKTHPAEAIMEAYNGGQRDFGENRPQELVAKYEALPRDIRWHMIGSLQTNKVKYIAPFVYLIHSVDSEKLLEVINKEGAKNNRIIDVLMEIHIADENTKHGWEPDELSAYMKSEKWLALPYIRIRGVMGMATFTDDREQVHNEFRNLKRLFGKIKQDNPKTGAIFDTISMGMSGDYPIAIEEGSTMVRIGSAIFGAREYKK